MSRPLRELKPDHTYHVTVRCNNRRFNLSRKLCREVFIHAIRRAKQKYEFHLYALCMMSNHVHYLIEPARQEDLPRIMHWLNWYSAMCFNRMLKRTGHFWEQRYHSSAFPTDDRKRALNTLRYIHANPRVAGVTRSFIYRYSNYGIYAKLSDERLTTWHPAFLELGDTLEKCASRYRRCTGEEECCLKPRADHGHIAKRERVSLLSVQSGVRYRRTKNCPRPSRQALRRSLGPMVGKPTPGKGKTTAKGRSYPLLKAR